MPFGLLLPVFLTMFWGDHPFHALAGLVGSTRNFLEGLVERQVVANRVLVELARLAK
jgi:hypothetical protein